jgi:hypothetical protein
VLLMLAFMLWALRRGQQVRERERPGGALR